MEALENIDRFKEVYCDENNKKPLKRLLKNVTGNDYDDIWIDEYIKNGVYVIGKRGDAEDVINININK